MSSVAARAVTDASVRGSHTIEHVASRRTKSAQGHRFWRVCWDSALAIPACLGFRSFNIVLDVNRLGAHHLDTRLFEPTEKLLHFVAISQGRMVPVEIDNVRVLLPKALVIEVLHEAHVDEIV